MNPKSESFTAKFSGRTNVLISQTRISQAFNPISGGVHPPTFEFNAIWDTGATATAINRNVIETCGLKPIGITEVNTANGTRRAEVYLINVILRNNVGITNIRASEADIHGADVLIGMDIISQGDFAITCREQKTIFSFRIPSICTIDFVEEYKKAQEPIRHDNIKPSRNAPCPCGSGKKYKKCCGI